MDRADRDRFERMQASARTLAPQILALDGAILAATMAADEVGRAAQTHRWALDSTMSADDELRTAMFRMEPATAGHGMPWLLMLVVPLVGWLSAGAVWGWKSDWCLVWGVVGYCLGTALAFAVSDWSVGRFTRLAAAERLRVVGVPLLAGPIPMQIVAPGEATLESLDVYVAALEAGVTERVAFLQAERTRKSLTEAEVQRLELELQNGVAQRPDLVSQHESARREHEERMRQQPNVDYYA